MVRILDSDWLSNQATTTTTTTATTMCVSRRRHRQDGQPAGLRRFCRSRRMRCTSASTRGDDAQAPAVEIYVEAGANVPQLPGIQ